MIDLINSTFENVIIHRVYEKRRDEEQADCTLATSTVVLNDEVEYELKDRINNAFGTAARSFELKISKVEEGTFFDYSTQIISNENVDFIHVSQLIAVRLAASHFHSSIPGGYLLIIDGHADNKKFVIAIKAELHTAFASKNDEEGRAHLELIKDIFLSPASKFYKVGLIYESDNTEFDYPNRDYSCMLYDDQFRPGQNPAEYFYDAFLGFSINDNDKLKTRKFFDEFTDFVMNNISDFSLKDDILTAFRSTLRTDTTGIVNPEAIGDQYFSDDTDIMSQFSSRVLINYPHPFTKNTTLVDFKLKRKSVKFPFSIKIAGPEDVFNANVKFFPNLDSIEVSPEEAGRCTFIKIIGRPYED